MKVPPLLLCAAVAGAVLVSNPAHARQAAESAPGKKLSNPEPMPRRGFNVVLLLGDMQDAAGQDTIPVAARKALSDMKDFLPYKGYRLLDTQWVLASNSGPAITRLRGTDDQEYELELRASPTMQPDARGFNQTGISVRFFLREASDGTTVSAGEGSGRTALHPKELSKADAAALEVSREIFQLERERDDLQILINKGRAQVEVGTKDPLEVKRQETQLAAITRRIADLKQSLSASSTKAGGRAVIDTSFRMDDGETVVVGTSKVRGGGRALIALLTATTDRGKTSSK
jgi:hypothetical protein